MLRAKFPHWHAALLMMVLVALVHGLTLDAQAPDVADARQYVAAAHNLATHGTFSEAQTPAPLPGTGREPGYSGVLALVFLVTRPFSGGDAACLGSVDGCSAERYDAALWLNAAFIGVAGLATWATAHRLTCSYLAAWVAAGYIWLNAEAATDKNYLISDWFAVFLAAASGLALVRAIQISRKRDWGLAGLALAGLLLTKAVFAPFAILLVVGLAGVGLRKTTTEAVTSRNVYYAGLLVMMAALIIPVGGWMARNVVVADTFSLSSGRTAVVLSAREIYNDMSPDQTLAAMVFWTRGFGDDLARDLWPREIWAPLRYETPGGYYEEGHARAERSVLELMRTANLRRVEAEKRVAEDYKDAILDRPLRHTMAFVALFWRGLWIDEFIVIGFPALVWASIDGVRRKRSEVVLALSIGIFSLIFYPLVSLNVPRYQMTALPALAVASGWIALHLRRRVARPRTAAKGAEEEPLRGAR